MAKKDGVRLTETQEADDLSDHSQIYWKRDQVQSRSKSPPWIKSQDESGDLSDVFQFTRKSVHT